MKKHLTAIAAVLCGLLLTACVRTPGASVPGTDASGQPSPESLVETQPQRELLTFPMELEDGWLLLEPPFSYDGLNPDSGNAESKNIAAVTVKNTSAEHLLRAELTLVAADGTQASFLLEHIPSGKQVTAFALDNTAAPADGGWVEVQVTAQFTPGSGLEAQGVAVTEDGMLLNVTNNTGAELTNLYIYCHNLLGEEYFGGKAYPYEIKNLPAGETVTVEALDCILGIAEAAYTEGK